MKLRDLFKKKEKPKELDKPKEVEAPVYPEGTVMCEACGDPIYPYDKRKTHANKKFHLKCYRKAIKIAKSQITKGIGNL